MTQMKVAQVGRAGGAIELVEREVPQPGFGEVLVRVHACGICHSDAMVKEGHWPGIQYPRVPGHEIPGVVEEVGGGVKGWTKASGSAWAGTAGTAAIARPAAGATSSIVNIFPFRVLPMTAAMKNI